jgi:UV DNA damage endonuclease
LIDKKLIIKYIIVIISFLILLILYNNMSIRLGYACINMELREFGIFGSRSLTLASLKKKGIPEAKRLALDNIDDVMKIQFKNEGNGWRFFRLTSNLFPHMENPQAVEKYDISFAKYKLKIVGKIVKKYGHRMTMHPGQFVQLGTPHEKVLHQSFADLKIHADIFVAMNLKPTDGSVLIIHGGGSYGDKQATLKRWMENFKKLPKYVQQYIVLENDEYQYGVMDLLPVCEKLKIPFCLDIFHNKVHVHPEGKVKITDELIGRILKTWEVRGIQPKIHISEQEPGLRIGAHSKTIDKLPKYVFQIPRKFGVNLDIMLEVKDKEISVNKMYKKYFNKYIDKDDRVQYEIKKKYQ